MSNEASIALVAWGNAWLTGHVGLDEAADAVERVAGPQMLGTAPAEVPLRRGLGDLRVAGLHGFRLALPRPGDPLGLTGPPAFNARALDAGAAVVAALRDRPLGLVPADDLRGSSYVGVRWEPCDAAGTEPDVPSLADAERQLTLTMRDATEALLTVEGARGVPPEIADALTDLRDAGPADHPLAPGYPARAHRVAALAGRLSLVVDLARRMEGGLTAEQIQRRDGALRLLDAAVRRALVAACDSVFDPVP
ncbi:hypothetical protein [Actinomadura flavalba]|uniref:hypothetical protein n=1 Tax=Actinomadura flavalba TaxID=1120938 RepID=UPI00036D69C1|nr:hypothetical protein [Actinomadura flavalba]